ncbi:ATPase [Chitinophaga varians]|uniref:ATPase n=1 Tax=Chitinophaga varians TaxID=2202339 RepID=UPI00165F3170|nr:ATPase [Chitinophaga varians]MBC9913897.1 ATPase [Chitinophaga varians]
MAETPNKSKTIHPFYDYTQITHLLEECGKRIYGPHFQIDKIDYPVVHKLLIYHLQDEVSAANEGIDLHKGILLTGKIGCGKTTLMTLMQPLCTDVHQYHIVSCRDISFEFGKIGFDIIYKYSHNAFHRSSNMPKVYCFDDWGLEANTIHRGNTCNAVAEILLSRYELFISKKMLTHVTTNLNSQKLEDTYGLQLSSRIRTMFNMIAFDVNTRDKRN